MRELALLLVLMLSVACSTSLSAQSAQRSAESLSRVTSADMLLFSAYVARDRVCMRATRTRPANVIYVECMRRGELSVCDVSEADLSDISALLRHRPEVANRSSLVEQARASIEQRCGAIRSLSHAERQESRWRITDSCETVAPFLRARVRSAWINQQPWPHDTKAAEGGWCSGNIGVEYYTRHCSDYLLSQWRVRDRGRPVFGFEQSVCGVI